MPLREHYPTLEDLRPAYDPDYLLTLFRKLAYRAEAEWIPLDPAELECPDRAGCRRGFLLADPAHPPGLQVLLFEMDAVRMANLRLLARDLLTRPGHYLFVAAPGEPPYSRVVFVHPRWVGDGQVAIRKLVLDPAHPNRHGLDVLEGIAAGGLAEDTDRLYLRQAEAFDVERLTDRFYRAYAGLFQRTVARVQRPTGGTGSWRRMRGRGRSHSGCCTGCCSSTFCSARAGWRTTPTDRMIEKVLEPFLGELQSTKGCVKSQLTRCCATRLVNLRPIWVHRCIKHDGTDALRAVVEETTLEERV